VQPRKLGAIPVCRTTNESLLLHHQGEIPGGIFCPKGGGFHDPGALFAQQHQKHPHKREEKFVISFIIFPNTLFGDKMILSMIMMSVTPMRAMFG